MTYYLIKYAQVYFWIAWLLCNHRIILFFSIFYQDRVEVGKESSIDGELIAAAN